MDFRVELTSRAQRDVEALYAWLAAEQAGDAGARWFTALREAVASLRSLPMRCQVAPESRQWRVEIRQLL